MEMFRRLNPLFDICVYTASEKVYANAILDKVDPSGQFLQRRLYRDKCTKAHLDGGRVVYLKDLRCIQGYQMNEIIIVDNSLLSFALQPENGIPISSYFYDPQDIELKCLCNYLSGKVFNSDDIRNVNREEFKLQSIIDLALQT